MAKTQAYIIATSPIELVMPITNAASFWFMSINNDTVPSMLPGVIITKNITIAPLIKHSSPNIIKRRKLLEPCSPIIFDVVNSAAKIRKKIGMCK